MKKYYADILDTKTNTQITIGEYSETAIQNSIVACIKQRGFSIDTCTWNIREEEI